MTFYNVISALLFFGAVRQLLLAIQLGEVGQMLMAATFGLLVFNDALYTSHVVEGSKTAEYKLPLMLVDLTNFALLAMAMIAINPGNNPFDVAFTRLPPNASEPLFWLLIAVYWGLVMAWTVIAGLYPAGYPRRLIAAAGGVIILFAVSAVVAAASPNSLFHAWIRAASIIYVIGYVAIIRPLMLARWRRTTRTRDVIPVDSSSPPVNLERGS